MGDEKYYTVQVKGQAYRFRPLDPTSLERIMLVQSMTSDQSKILKAISLALSEASVGESWAKLFDRWLTKEIATTEITVDLLKTLIDRQKADEKKPKGAKNLRTDGTLDVASSLPADAE